MTSSDSQSDQELYMLHSAVRAMSTLQTPSQELIIPTKLYNSGVTLLENLILMYVHLSKYLQPRHYDPLPYFASS